MHKGTEKNLWFLVQRNIFLKLGYRIVWRYSRNYLAKLVSIVSIQNCQNVAS